MLHFFFTFGVVVGVSDYTYGVNEFLKYPNNEILRLNLVNERLLNLARVSLKRPGLISSVVTCLLVRNIFKPFNVGQMNLVENIFSAEVNLI